MTPFVQISTKLFEPTKNLRLEIFHKPSPVVGLWSWGLGPQNFVSRCGRKIVTSSMFLSEAVVLKLRFREPELQVPNLPPFLPVSIFVEKLTRFFNAFGYLVLLSQSVFTLEPEKNKKRVEEVSAFYRSYKRVLLEIFSFFAFKILIQKKKPIEYWKIIVVGRQRFGKYLSLRASRQMVRHGYSLYKLHLLFVQRIFIPSH